MFSVADEYSPLTTLCVCRGTCVPDYEAYPAEYSEFKKYPIQRWSTDLLLRQQDELFAIFDRYGVALHFPEPRSHLPWQMYTRDTGFVVGDKLFYCRDRGLPDRVGEIDSLLASLPNAAAGDFVEITAGTIEGGDVLVHQGTAYVGISARTMRSAIDELARHVDVVPLELGQTVMHLDTRMTILPRRKLLIYPPAFRPEDLQNLRGEFDFIEVSKQECNTLGTNVFVIDPETVLVHQGHGRIIERLKASGFDVLAMDYSEPIAIAGSFRCTTLPLVRD